MTPKEPIAKNNSNPLLPIPRNKEEEEEEREREIERERGWDKGKERQRQTDREREREREIDREGNEIIKWHRCTDEYRNSEYIVAYFRIWFI